MGKLCRGWLVALVAIQELEVGLSRRKFPARISGAFGEESGAFYGRDHSLRRTANP